MRTSLHSLVSDTLSYLKQDDWTETKVRPQAHASQPSLQCDGPALHLAASTQRTHRESRIEKTRQEVSVASVVTREPAIDRDGGEVWKAIQRAHPHVKKRQPPSDQRAREVASAWGRRAQRAPIALIAHKEKPAGIETMERLRKALCEHVAEAKVIDAELWEQAGLWHEFCLPPQLELIVVSQSTLDVLPSLREYLKEPLPAVVVAPPWENLSSLQVKRELWNALLAARRRPL